jgi:hypothetical protein
LESVLRINPNGTPPVGFNHTDWLDTFYRSGPPKHQIQLVQALRYVLTTGSTMSTEPIGLVLGYLTCTCNVPARLQQSTPFLRTMVSTSFTTNPVMDISTGMPVPAVRRSNSPYALRKTYPPWNLPREKRISTPGYLQALHGVLSVPPSWTTKYDQHELNLIYERWHVMLVRCVMNTITVHEHDRRKTATTRDVVYGVQRTLREFDQVLEGYSSDWGTTIDTADTRPADPRTDVEYTPSSPESEEGSFDLSTTDSGAEESCRDCHDFWSDVGDNGLCQLCYDAYPDESSPPSTTLSRIPMDLVEEKTNHLHHDDTISSGEQPPLPEPRPPQN